MIKNIFSEAQIESLKSILDSSESIVLTCHKSPDGDAVGATMGFCQVLKQLGKKARVVVPNMLTKQKRLRLLKCLLKLTCCCAWTTTMPSALKDCVHTSNKVLRRRC